MTVTAHSLQDMVKRFASLDFPPVVPGPWVALSGAMTEVLRQRAEETGAVDAARAIESVRALALPFFPGWMLCDLLLGEVGPVDNSEVAVLVMLYGPDGFTRLDAVGTIASHIQRHGISLTTAEDCRAYADFALTFGGLGSAWAPSFSEAVQTSVTLCDPPTPSPLDNVRAPEIAKLRLRARNGSRLSLLTLRLGSDGALRILSREDIPGPVPEPAPPRGRLRILAKREGDKV